MAVEIEAGAGVMCRENSSWMRPARGCYAYGYVRDPRGEIDNDIRAV